jgi:hypothetical protein
MKMKTTQSFKFSQFYSISILAFAFAANYSAVADSLTVTGDLKVEGIATVGNNVDLPAGELSAGSIRWTGSALEVYDGVSWKTIPISVFAEDGSARWGSNTNSVTGLYSTVWGFKNTVSGLNATGWGGLNTVSGNFSNSWGFGNTSSGINVTAWGKNNVASGDFSTVWGFNNNVNGVFATAWGRYVNAPASFSTVVGKFNIGGVSTSADGDDSNEGATVWIKQDPLIEVGMGRNNQNRSNALTLLKDGRIAFGEHNALDNLQSQPETVQIQGALKVGDYSGNDENDASEGAIRYSSNDLLGYVDGTWKSLTQDSHFTGNLQVDGDIVLADHAGDIPSITY